MPINPEHIVGSPTAKQFCADTPWAWAVRTTRIPNDNWLVCEESLAKRFLEQLYAGKFCYEGFPIYLSAGKGCGFVPGIPVWRGMESAPRDGTRIIVAYPTKQILTDDEFIVREAWFERIGWVASHNAVLCDDYEPIAWQPMPAYTQGAHEEV